MIDSSGKIILSVMAVLVFIATVSFICIKGVPPEAKDLINQVIGAEISWVTMVMGFWVGSSIGSARKDQTIRDQLPPPTNPEPDSNTPPKPKPDLKPDPKL